MTESLQLPVQATWDVRQTDCRDGLRSLADNSVDLVFGSPPYVEKGERYDGHAKCWKLQDWIYFMLSVTTEAVRVSRGYVVWVANGAVRKRRYVPAVEGLIWQAHLAGITCERPAIWSKNAPPNRTDWFRNDWEFCAAFRSPESRPYFDWEAIAQPPKYKSGGHFRQRGKNGQRRRGGDYPQSNLARPSDVLRVTVGGGHLGHELAHKNEAPFPERLAEVFVLACCPPDGIVCDPFCGSGTTLDVAQQHNRNSIGFDIRESQIELTHRRLS